MGVGTEDYPIVSGGIQHCVIPSLTINNPLWLRSGIIIRYWVLI